MSDLAPFVAATLRDKVVQDLMKENEELRSKLAAAEKDQESDKGLKRQIAYHAIHGYMRDVRLLAVTGPSPPDGSDEDPLVYSIQVGVSGSGFETSKINDCTLEDLSNAQYFINGASCGPLSQKGLEYDFCVYPDDPFEVYLQFWCGDLRDDGDQIMFSLSVVPVEKWFAFAGFDYNEWLANKREIEIPDRQVSFNDIVDFFGGQTMVLLHDS